MKAKKEKHEQLALGQLLANVFLKIIFHCGASRQFEVVSFPDGNIFKIKIFKIDSNGEPLFKGSKYRGIVVFSVEIQLPILFCFFFENLKGEKRFVNCISAEDLNKKSKAMLEELLCSFCLSSIESYW